MPSTKPLGLTPLQRPTDLTATSFQELMGGCVTALPYPSLLLPTPSPPFFPNSQTWLLTALFVLYRDSHSQPLF